MPYLELQVYQYVDLAFQHLKLKLPRITQGFLKSLNDVRNGSVTTTFFPAALRNFIQDSGQSPRFWRSMGAIRGHTVPTTVDCKCRCCGVNTCRLNCVVGRSVEVDDLVDAQGVADLLGLAQRNTVSLYQRRYPAMPRPVVDLGRGRCKMWLRSEIATWVAQRQHQVKVSLPSGKIC